MASCLCPTPNYIAEPLDIQNPYQAHTCPPLDRDLQDPEFDTTLSSFIQTPSSEEYALPFYDNAHQHLDNSHDFLSGGSGKNEEDDVDVSLEELDRALEEAIAWDHLNVATHGQDGYEELTYEHDRGRQPRKLDDEEMDGMPFYAVDTLSELASREDKGDDGISDWDHPDHRPRSVTPRVSTTRRSRKAAFSPSISGTRTRTSSTQTLRAARVSCEPVIDVYTAGAKELIYALDAGTVTSVQIMEAYLDQIERYNGILRAVTHVAPRGDLLRLARACDKQRKYGLVDRERMMLHGLPVLVKDNIATDELLGMPTTAGSFALLGMPVKKDAFVVQKLREAGAIVIGKANMSELASYKSANVPDGWSAVGGQTINVYAPHASPGTSSSGSGVALAAGFCALSLATETDGSITLPCLQSCLYGLKPTVGLLSRAGIVPFAPTFDTAGPMAKDVWSLAVMMDVMQGADAEDQASMAIERIPNGVKYVDSCESPTFRGLRIGVPRKNWLDIDPWRRPGRDILSSELSDAFENALAKMAALGAVVTDPAEIPSAVDGSLWRCVFGSRSLIVAADCNAYLTKYLQGLGGEGGCRSVEDIIKFNEDHADIEMPPGYYGQEVLTRCLDAVSIDSPEHAAAQEEMQLVAGKYGLDAVMDEYDLDALVCVREGCHSLANMVGAPIASVPLGLLSDNTPIGAYFIDRRGSERTLIRIMAAWEAAFGKRPVPPIARIGNCIQ